jgi:glycosyltransferase involved in cell wall biosynthesis
MNAVVEEAAGPSSKPVILHLVGGDSAQGGLMSYVRAITQEPLPGFQQFIWKHRHYAAQDPDVLRLGWCRTVDRSIVRDILGALLDLIPLCLWLRRQEVVIVHAHTRTGTLLGALVHLLRRVPFVVYVHARWRQTGSHRLLWRFTRATVVFNSRMTCLHFGFAPELSHILPPTIQWPVAPPPGKGSFVASSHIVRWKNVHLIIEAFLRISQEGQSLHIYGFSSATPEPEYQEEIVRLAKPHSNICLHQWDPRWTDSLRAGDIFVHAADKEPFGIVILEAYARGIRMVVPHGTFLDDLPLEGVFRSDLNPSALAQAMERAFVFPCSDELWRQRHTVAGQFSLENMRQELARIYRDRISRN